MNNETLEILRERFGHDRFATQAAGIIIEDAAQGYARTRMDIVDVHMNAMGFVMGGAIFTLADFTFAVASNFERMNTQSLTSQITFHRTAKGSSLFGEAKCIRSGRSTCYYVTDITDDTGRLIATVATTGFIRGE